MCCLQDVLPRNWPRSGLRITTAGEVWGSWGSSKCERIELFSLQPQLYCNIIWEISQSSRSPFSLHFQGVGLVSCLSSLQPSSIKMPVCAIHLLSLHPATKTIPAFLHTLHSHSSTLKPLVVSRVIRWIILPTSLSTPELLAQKIHWDILLIVPSTTPLPTSLQNLIQHQWTVYAGVPSRLLVDFHSRNHRLLHPEKGDIPPLTGSLSKPRIATSAQGLELSRELREWIQTFSQSSEGQGAVSMLNLLAFQPGKKEGYLKYGAEFSKSIGSRRGGNAKIVGSVVHDAGGEDGEAWDEVALAHYPSILHFADMLASQDYQAVNQKYRVPSLKDTFILCTSEIGIDDFGSGGEGPKL